MGQPVFSGILTPGRLKLLYYLITGPRTPTELATIEDKHLSEISRNLASLRRMGLVVATQSGSRERYYKITSDGYVAYAAFMQRIR
jgi:DNA-binding transcriptional ArsR family regulator